MVLAADPTGHGLAVQEPGAVPQALGEVDVVFPLLHGPYGEDGTIQGLLELAGVPYVGSGVLASAARHGQGGHEARARLGRPAGRALGDGDRPAMAVRPRGGACAGSSSGWPCRCSSSRPGPARPSASARSRRWADLREAVEQARAHDPKVVVEQGVEGREIECGVLEGPGGGPEASVCAEIRVVGDHEFYDFAAKYLDDVTELDVPAEVPGGVADEVRRLACSAFDALGCEGLARVDFFLRPDGSLVVNEVNTIPGFTPVSMFPRMWAASGVDYPALVDRLIAAALARRPGLLR